MVLLNLFPAYSGTSIKRTPLGNSLLAVIERWSYLEGLDCQLCMLSESFLAANESWGFANYFFSSYKL